jgi:5-enolpyruvylshikimate-3-phosphate synthase
VSLAATTTTVTSNPTVVFSANTQTVTLTATVSSAGIPVNGGVVTFMIAGVGADVQANVNNGQATTTFTINAGIAPSMYTIEADYAPAPGFHASSGNGTLTISPVATTTTVGNVTAVFSRRKQTVTLTATVGSGAGPVNGGTITFHIAGVGADVQANVVNGQATTTFTINPGIEPGMYTIVGDYSPAADFSDSSGSGTLTISRHRH